MSGRIELHQGLDGQYRVKIVDDLNKTLAVSKDFLSRKEALTGVFVLREILGTAHVSDCTKREAATDQAMTVA